MTLAITPAPRIRFLAYTAKTTRESRRKRCVPEKRTLSPFTAGASPAHPEPAEDTCHRTRCPFLRPSDSKSIQIQQLTISH